MTCRDYRDELMEWARGGDPQGSLRVHVSGCADCARYLEDQRALTASLRGMSAEEIPSALEMGVRVMAEFDRSAARPRTRVLGWMAAAGLAAAASLAMLVSPPKPAPPVPAAETGQFLPIPYTVPLSPEERATVVRMDIPVTALIAAGYRVDATDPSAMVQAEVLVSQDGRARAIRLLSISNSN